MCSLRTFGLLRLVGAGSVVLRFAFGCLRQRPVLVRVSAQLCTAGHQHLQATDLASFRWHKLVALLLKNDTLSFADSNKHAPLDVLQISTVAQGCNQPGPPPVFRDVVRYITKIDPRSKTNLFRP